MRKSAVEAKPRLQRLQETRHSVTVGPEAPAICCDAVHLIKDIQSSITAQDVKSWQAAKEALHLSFI